MNTPGINPEKFYFQSDSQRNLELQLLALKESLLYCLGSFLVSNYEVLDNPFTVLLSRNQSDTILETDISTQVPTSGDSIDWRTISLKSEVIETSLVYICALPRMLRRNYDFYSAKSLRLQTQRLAEELNQFQLQSISSLVTLPNATFTLLSNLWNEFTAELEKPGWIVFKLSNQGLWYWLEQFQTNAHQTKPKHTLFIRRLLLNEVDADSLTHLCTESSIECSRSHADSIASSLSDSQLQSLRGQLPAYPKPLQTSRGEKIALQLLWQIHYTLSCCNSLVQQAQASQSSEQIVSRALSSKPPKLSKTPLGWQNSSYSQARTPQSTQPQNIHQFSIVTSSSAQALILEIVRTIDVIYADIQRNDSRIGQNPVVQSKARRKIASKKASLSLKQSVRLCLAFDNFYRTDWPLANSIGYPDRPKLALSKQVTTRSHEMVQLLIAAKETLQILLHHYQEPTAESL